MTESVDSTRLIPELRRLSLHTSVLQIYIVELRYSTVSFLKMGSEKALLTEPPSKKIRNDLQEVIIECYNLKFSKFGQPLGDSQYATVKSGIKRIRETVELATSSSDVSFGSTKPSAKINWGKCLALLLDDGPESLLSVKILTEKLNPGGGLL